MLVGILLVMQAQQTEGCHRSRPLDISTHLSRPTDKMASEQVVPVALTQLH